MKEVFKYQKIVLSALSGQVEDFYLVGGTALSSFYFHHRESYDLDFFTKDFSWRRVNEVVKGLEQKTGKKVQTALEEKTKKFAQRRTCEMLLGNKESLKIDFVEDFLDVLKPFEKVNGVNVASLDDIYYRKVYAVTGVPDGGDKLGKMKTKGGRQEARDLFDLYYLSHTYKRLSSFVQEFSDHVYIEGLVTWWQSINKRDMQQGIGEIHAPQTGVNPDAEFALAQEPQGILERGFVPR